MWVTCVQSHKKARNVLRFLLSEVIHFFNTLLYLEKYVNEHT